MNKKPIVLLALVALIVAALALAACSPGDLKVPCSGDVGCISAPTVKEVLTVSAMKTNTAVTPTAVPTAIYSGPVLESGGITYKTDELLSVAGKKETLRAVKGKWFVVAWNGDVGTKHLSANEGTVYELNEGNSIEINVARYRATTNEKVAKQEAEWLQKTKAVTMVNP